MYFSLLRKGRQSHTRPPRTRSRPPPPCLPSTLSTPLPTLPPPTPAPRPVPPSTWRPCPWCRPCSSSSIPRRPWCPPTSTPWAPAWGTRRYPWAPRCCPWWRARSPPSLSTARLLLRQANFLLLFTSSILLHLYMIIRIILYYILFFFVWHIFFTQKLVFLYLRLGPFIPFPLPLSHSKLQKQNKK